MERSGVDELGQEFLHLSSKGMRKSSAVFDRPSCDTLCRSCSTLNVQFLSAGRVCDTQNVACFDVSGEGTEAQGTANSESSLESES